MFPKKTIQRNRIIYHLRKYKNFLIIGHKKPDGDAVGSMLALHLALKSVGKNTILACDDHLSERFNFLPDADKIKLLEDVVKIIDNIDLVITLDSGVYQLTGLDTHFSKKELPMILNIDHHQDNPHYGQINLVEADKSSTCEIIYHIIKAINVEIDDKIATCILNGIFLDTDSFKNPNTSTDTLKITSNLLSRGANLKEITKSNLKDKSLSALKLWGITLARLRKNSKLGIISTVVTRSDLENCNASYEDLEGVANFLNSIPEAKASLVLSERDKNEIKGSFRTLHDEVDVSKLAALFGGGGHKKAAGFTIPGQLQKDKNHWKII